MAEIGYGYGSEWHLMRFMARHRKCLERAICEKLDDEESKFVWLDFDFANKTDSSITGDVEIKGLSFLQSDEIKDHLSNELLDKIKKEYIIGWENTQSWDAIFLKGNTIFLVEAKAHRDELKSGNDIHGGKSHKEIKSFIGRQFSSLGINENDEWLKNYYQFANRLATTIFLKKHLNDINLDVKLLYICGIVNAIQDKLGNSCSRSLVIWLEPYAETTQATNIFASIDHFSFMEEIAMFQIISSLKSATTRLT